MYAYVFSLVGDHARTADIVQETNLVLWRKRDQYQTHRPFLPWASTFARFQVLAHLRDKSRDRLLLDADLAEQLSAQSGHQAEHFERLQTVLGHCIGKLPEKNRVLVQRRYTDADSIGRIAAHTGQTESAVKVALMRIRKQLAKCVRGQLAVEGE